MEFDVRVVLEDQVLHFVFCDSGSLQFNMGPFDVWWEWSLVWTTFRPFEGVDQKAGQKKAACFLSAPNFARSCAEKLFTLDSPLELRPSWIFLVDMAMLGKIHMVLARVGNEGSPPMNDALWFPPLVITLSPTSFC